MIGCRFLNNSTTELTGGAIVGTEGSHLTIEDCFFSGNWATDSGGGVAFFDSHPTISRCTFIDNEAVNGGGGAVFSGWGAHVRLDHCTMVGNSAAFGAGVMCYEASAELEQCIVAFSAAGDAVRCFSQSTAMLTCSNLYGNPGGDWIGYIEAQFGLAGNICQDPLFCGDENPGEPYTLQEDSPCAAEQNPSCGAVGAWPVGCGAASGIQAGSTPGPVVVRLGHSVPNPARSMARIDYALPATAAGETVRLRIFDIAGRLVRTLIDGPQTMGVHSAVWDGADDRGRTVATGIYFYRLTVGNEQLTRKLLLAR